MVSILFKIIIQKHNGYILEKWCKYLRIVSKERQHSTIHSKHIFVYLQRTVRSSNQEQNPHILDTFKVNADNYDCYL